jgi:hypothetical protein
MASVIHDFEEFLEKKKKKRHQNALMFLAKASTTKIKKIGPNTQSNFVPKSASLSIPVARNSIASITITPRVDLPLNKLIFFLQKER